MTEILHSQAADAIQHAQAGSLPSAFLIHGQEMLVEKVIENLVTKLLDGAARDLCCQTIEGQLERIPGILAQINTFSLMPEPKIIIFKEAKLFESGGSHQRLAMQIIESCENESLDLAAKSLINLCGRLEIDLPDVMGVTGVNESLQLLSERLGPEGLDRLVQHARSMGLPPAAGGKHLETLQLAVEKGFADGHYLIVTVTAKVPKNLKIYKSMRDHGWVIDCNVPLGERRADRMAQEDVLRSMLERIMAQSHKRLQPGLFETLCQLTGFDLRTFVQNIEKLVDYTGRRAEITADDVHEVLRRTKSDPIFELTNAVADRNLDQALFYLRTMLEADWYPLQILSALTNQLRRLIIAKDFCISPQGKNWAAGMGYPQFKSAVMPAVVSFDRHNQEILLGWQHNTEQKKKGKAGAAKVGQDTALAPNPNNPYPVYQTLLKTTKFTRRELLDALVRLNQTDLRLKSTGQNAALVLGNTIVDICKIKKD